MHTDNPKPPYLIAEIWWCGDGVCNCIQPQITRIKPKIPPMQPWIDREVLWQGTFISCADSEDLDNAKLELREAADRFEIPLNEETMTGHKYE